MKKVTLMLSVFLLMVSISSGVFAHNRHWGWKDASGDQPPRSFQDGYDRKMKHLEDGFIFFPGAEIGVGSGVFSGSLGINMGYKSGLFLIGTSLSGQIVNIDRVNYQFIPIGLNICGLSYSVIPETGNSQNDKKLKGWSIGYAMGGKLTFSQMIETDPDTNAQKEYSTVNFGVGV